MKKLKVVSAIFFAILYILFIPINSVLGSTNLQSKLNIEISPKEYLFNIDNMKPGDWAPRTITIQNKGENEFEYYTTIKNDGGSEKLFNELMLEISDDNGILYEGKLSNLKELPPRKLESSQQEKFNFTVRFPKNLGNEYQGLQTEFLLTFHAEGKLNVSDEAVSKGSVGSGGIDSVSQQGSELPDTATSMFNFLLIGSAFLFIGGSLILIKKAKRIARND